ncbi:hypothetical protein QE357_003811 [Siphonobacter sp. BAB-5404]|nr:hypothetical protein [Siphonobacter sp. SORGH_AS_0500]
MHLINYYAYLKSFTINFLSITMSLFFRLTFVIYFFSYLNFTVSGQHIIELPEHTLTTNNLGFNFKKVIDARLFKDNIGLLQMN